MTALALLWFTAGLAIGAFVTAQTLPIDLPQRCSLEDETPRRGER